MNEPVPAPIGLFALLALPFIALRSAGRARLQQLRAAGIRRRIHGSNEAIALALEAIELEETFIDTERRRQDVLYRQLRQLDPQSTNQARRMS